MSGVNKVILISLYVKDKKSIPIISEEVGLSRSAVRYHLEKAGVLRSRSEGVRMAGNDGRLGSGTRGKTRKFSMKHKENISKSKLKWGEKNAKSLSIKPSGYVEITRGPRKGKAVHIVIMEAILGRPLNENEVVHHIDCNPSNNDPRNLRVMSKGGHLRLHRAMDITERQRDQLGRFVKGGSV
jgi:hypothetical protein